MSSAGFNFSASPFDCLNAAERQRVRDSIDIAYFREGETILGVGAAPSHLFVVIKGRVRQFEAEEPVAVYGPDECFDGRGLVAGKVSSRFVAAEEVVAYQLARATVMELISANATFGALLFADLSQKLGALGRASGVREMQSLMMTRVSDAYLRPAHMVDAGTDMLSVVEIFQTRRTSNVLVRDTATDPPRLGIFTATGLQRAILGTTPLGELPVGRLASFPLVTVQPTQHVFDAMAKMIRHKVHRVVVAEGERVIGVLEQLDLLSFLSNNSYLITVQIVQANDLQALKEAAAQIPRLIALLHRGGTRVPLIAQLVQEINATLFERAWQLVAPADLVDNSCLFVMGSEGRGEQLLKTDQDNGLVLRDGYECPHDLQAVCERFSQALGEFGYPPCPGDIMLSNPRWRQPAAQFGQTVRGWLLQPTPESLMDLAIFVDAHAVAGPAALLESVRQRVFELARGNDVLVGRFAAAIDAFTDSTGWWNRLLSLGAEEQGHVHLKKAGIFPLVHGVRSLALQQGIAETGTVARIEALVGAGQLSREEGRELADSLHFLMGLKLSAGLEEMELGREVSGDIEPERLSVLERDLLKDALAAVKRFKAMLRQRLHLDQL